MFFTPERIHNNAEMIRGPDTEGRRKALAKLLPYQREDFIGIFKAMKGLPVTIRLLDPPLHEFLPHNEKDQVELAKSLGLSAEQVKNRVQQLTRPTRCSATAATASRSPTPRSSRCRSARSSRPPSNRSRTASRSSPRS
jgi:phosphoenolpyruvate synthase/pyruvate phosphate dikinase